MKLVILDSYALHEGDLNWLPMHNIVEEIDEYPRTTDEQALSRLTDADFAICNKVIFDEELFCKLPKLRWLGKIATGTDNIDLAAAKRHGVTVANVPDYSTHSVAQLVFAFMLSVCQCPERHDSAVKGGYWQLNVPKSFRIMPQQELYGRTIGLVGFGNIAQETAKIANAFGMKVICHTRTERKSELVSFMPLHDMLHTSDFVSLHCPLTEKTRGIINESSLRHFKSGAVLINTARGALIDEPAVAAAIASGAIKSYCADVFEAEPLPESSLLLKENNTILTPHIAWGTSAALERLAQEVCDNLSAYLRGVRRNVVN